MVNIWTQEELEKLEKQLNSIEQQLGNINFTNWDMGYIQKAYNNIGEAKKCLKEYMTIDFIEGGH